MKFIVATLGLLFFISKFSYGASLKCAKEGESAGGSTLSALRCCPGLVMTNKWVYEHSKNGCNIPPPPGSGGSCAKCGDGKCDTKNFESKCNCPKDCN